MADNKITFFACDNGDASLLEAHGWTVMTDVNYRAAASDDNNDDVNDFAPTIRKACGNDQLDVFVLTHPDEDHLRGFSEIFHLGAPGDRDPDPDDGPVKLLVNEMWCSPYAVNPNYTTDVSKPVLDEIARRKRLQGTASGHLDGNRLSILEATDGAQNQLTPGLDWRLLAPSAEEADIPKAADTNPPNSSNPSSLVIQWTITVRGKASKVLLAGDSTVEIWERIDAEFDDDFVDWHILLAPHHCSRHSMGRKEVKNGNETFIWSNEALRGLDHPLGMSPHVVSSSRKFGSKHPPHPQARERYWKMLAQGDEVTGGVKKRFKVTAGKLGEDADDVVFNFTANGPSFAVLSTPTIITSPSSSGGGGYG